MSPTERDCKKGHTPAQVPFPPKKAVKGVYITVCTGARAGVNGTWDYSKTGAEELAVGFKN